MSRPPKPWYWAGRQRWCATIDGRRRTLAEGPKAATKKAAEKEFHRLMQDRTGVKRGRALTLEGLASAFVLDSRARADRGEIEGRTALLRAERLGPFVLSGLGSTPAEDVRPADVEAFLAGNPGWGPNYRSAFLGILRTMYRWARGRELLSCDPPLPARSPPRKIRRDKIPTVAEMEAIIAKAPTEGLRDLLAFVRWTGCRPSEAARIAAGDVRDDAVELVEHKTRRKTGALRVIMLNEPSRAILDRLAGARAGAEGPLFRNEAGRPWSRFAWSKGFIAAREAARADPRITLYTFRHGRATELLVAGVELATVAALLGNDPSMTGRVYADVVSRREHLARAAGRGTGAGQGGDRGADRPDHD